MTEISRWSIPMRTGRGGNTRLMPRAAARIAKHERETTKLSALVAMSPRRWPPSAMRQVLRDHRFVVTLIRSSPGHVRIDDDNLVASLKHVRDGVADRFGVDDGDHRSIRFLYVQNPKIATWAVDVLVHLERRDA